jgi:CTP:phosphocholine cytidylyltransferase-like protein
MKFSANEQAKELITIFYPGSDIAQDMVDMAIGSRDDWRWERAIELSVKCCEKIIQALESQRIQSLDVNEYWEDVKQILQNK